MFGLVARSNPGNGWSAMVSRLRACSLLVCSGFRCGLEVAFRLAAHEVLMADTTRMPQHIGQMGSIPLYGARSQLE